jgi:hypothetical protein
MEREAMTKVPETNNKPDSHMNVGSFLVGGAAPYALFFTLGIIWVNFLNLDFDIFRLLLLLPVGVLLWLILRRPSRRIKEQLQMALIGYVVSYVSLWLMTDWGYVAENGTKPDGTLWY